jgi:UDP-N-acetylmuramate dehydrogenase
MNIQEQFPLKQLNTFGMNAIAECLAETHSLEDIAEAGEGSYKQKNIIGGGSNILLTKNLEGITLLNRIKGIKKIKENEQHVWIEVGGGEVWHELVMYAIENNLGGIENLALIPGTVGASPIQNIGAYGVEVQETIDVVNAWHWNEKTTVTFKNEDCQFGYRDSVFKNSLKGKVFITSVVFKLNKQHEYRTTYGAIAQELEKNNVTELSVKAIADAVIAIRSSKLPDPKVTGNAGSFFKNPTLPKSAFNCIQERHPDIPFYPTQTKEIKIPAGWLIEKLGWKGYRKGDAGVHPKQALVIVNYANATGTEIYNLSEEIIRSVKNEFGIELEREVQIW